MDILQLTNKIPYPPKDGGAIATLNVAMGLKTRGHHITLLGMNTSKHYVNLANIPKDLKNSIEFRSVKVDTGIKFWDAFRNLFLSDFPYNAVRFFDHRFERELVKLLQEKEFDVIQLEGLYMAYYIETIRKYSKARVALRAHNIEHEIWARAASQEKSVFKKRYFRILSSRIRKFKMRTMNSYDLLIPITQRDADFFNRMGNIKPVMVVPAGYDTHKLVPHRDEIQHPGVFFIGTLDWFPNQEGLVWFLEEIWSMVTERHPGLKFHIAGRNAPDWLQKLLNKQADVTYHGEIEDAYSYMNKNAIMVVPLFSGSGMRVKIIEGMALGKTIVTTSIGAEGIPVTHGENIFIEDTVKGYTEQITRLVEDRVLFDRIGCNAVDFVSDNFDNRKISADLANFYQKHIL